MFLAALLCQHVQGGASGVYSVWENLRKSIISMETRFPLIGFDTEAENEVFAVQNVSANPSNVPTAVLSLLSPSVLQCAEVMYCCYPLHTAFLRLYFHPCVFHVATALTWPVTAGLFFLDNEFSNRVVEILGAEMGRNELGRQFQVTMETKDQGLSHRFAADPAQIRVNLGAPVVTFSSFLCFEANGAKYQFLTRHTLVLYPYSPLATCLQSADFAAFQAALLGLQEAVINPNTFYGYPNHWVEKASQLLLGAAPVMMTSLLKELLHHLMWSLDGEPDQPDYGRVTHERICQNYAESDDEAMRLRLVTLWTAANRLIQDYYLLS